MACLLAPPKPQQRVSKSAPYDLFRIVVVRAVRLLVPLRIARVDMRLPLFWIWMIDCGRALAESFVRSTLSCIALSAVLLRLPTASQLVAVFVGCLPAR